MQTIWDKTELEARGEIAKKQQTEIQTQTVFLMEILKQIGEAIEANKSVKVENIVREVVGKVAVEKPDWIQELKQDTKPLEKKLDYIASAIIRKEVVRKMDFNRPDWIKELVPKDFVFPDSKDFSKPTVDILKQVLKAINDKEVVKDVSVTGMVEVKEPAWLKFPDIEKPIVALAKFIKKYFDNAVLKTEIQNEITISNPVREVMISNPVSIVSIKDFKKMLEKLDLISMQLRAMGTTGSNAAQVPTDPLITYKEINLDVEGMPIYLGYIRSDGAWYIKRINTDDNTTMYVSGKTDYLTAWSGRAGLVYIDFNQLTL